MRGMHNHPTSVLIGMHVPRTGMPASCVDLPHRRRCGCVRGVDLHPPRRRLRRLSDAEVQRLRRDDPSGWPHGRHGANAAAGSRLRCHWQVTCRATGHCRVIHARRCCHHCIGRLCNGHSCDHVLCQPHCCRHNSWQHHCCLRGNTQHARSGRRDQRQHRCRLNCNTYIPSARSLAPGQHNSSRYCPLRRCPIIPKQQCGV